MPVAMLAERFQQNTVIQTNFKNRPLMEPILAPLPWQTTQWQRLLTLRESKQLPPALLFKGPKGIGKLLLAKTFAQLLLCLQPVATGACFQCKSCQLIQANTHPDYQLLQPSNEQPLIKIDQIRDIIDFCNLSKQISPYKVIIIETAEAMNVAAANAFLKTLEEPSANTCILLLSHQASLLPATIRSRCQFINLALPQKLQAMSWLQSRIINSQSARLLLLLAGTAPLLALEYASNSEYLSQYENFVTSLINIALNKQDPIAAVTVWSKHNPVTLLHWMNILLLDLVRINTGLPKESLFNIAMVVEIRHLADKTDVFTLFQLLDNLNQTTQYLQQKINLNIVLLLENLFCDWYFVCNAAHKKLHASSLIGASKC
ncbi:DNA polymerase III subunit delta' [soil metagenome]